MSARAVKRESARHALESGAVIERARRVAVKNVPFLKISFQRRRNEVRAAAERGAFDVQNIGGNDNRGDLAAPALLAAPRASHSHHSAVGSGHLRYIM